MSSEKINLRTTVLLIMILAIGLIRVVFNFNHDLYIIANFSPLGAMAIFGGAYFDKRWKAIVFPLMTLFVSDLILHQTVFKSYSHGILYGGWYWVYGAIALMTIAGRWIMEKLTIARFFVSVLACVLIHWIVTDIGVWYGSSKFSQDIAGFIDCLILAIPYELKFLAGTVVYGAILFGGFEWMKQKVPGMGELKS
jgi:hypothetical protein